jgi:DNA-binding response OmpR family regulator
MKILLVEDDNLLADAIARALRTENFVVDIASNGEDGQHLGDTEAYDAAVLDLGLPEGERACGASSMALGGPQIAGAYPDRA